MSAHIIIIWATLLHGRGVIINVIFIKADLQGFAFPF